MRIIYIANARIPTEKAHGIAIMRACESFSREGAEIVLVVPHRRISSKDAFETYEIERNFRIVLLPTLDLFNTLPDRIAFPIQVSSFYASAAVWLLFGARDRVIYVRDAALCLFAWLGYRVAHESHLISKHRAIYFFLASRAFRLIVISKALKDAFTLAGFNEKEILVAPSGVDLSVFDIDISREDARKQLGLQPSARVAVYTGNFTTMDEDKGLNDIIAALKDVPKVMFVAVGGSEKDIVRYATQARRAGVADRVILRGHVVQKTLALYQKAADVLLMPFPDVPHYRNHMSPVKMFEYMASGRPIIASDLPTIREVLNEENSFIVPPGNPIALAYTICRLFDRPLDARRIAEHARGQVERYSWNERARRVLEFLSTKPL